MKCVILQVFCAIFSGAMLGLSISNGILPFGSPLLALFSLVPFYCAIYRSKSYREAFWISALQALTVHLISSWWLSNFKDYAIFTLGASAFGTALEMGLCGVFFYLPVSRFSKSKKLEENAGLHPFSMIFRMIWFTACYVMWEYIKSVKFLGYPWGTVSSASYRWKIIGQIADITGVWGITFLFVFFNSFVAEGILLLEKISAAQKPYSILKDYKQAGKLLLTVSVCVLAYGSCRYFIPESPVKHLNTIVVQPCGNPWTEDSQSEEEKLKAQMKLTEDAVNSMKEKELQPDLVVWSEGILDRSFPNSQSYYKKNPDSESLSAFIKRMNVPFLMGGRATVNREKRHYNNIAVLYDAQGNYSGFYAKAHLVPFAEEIPFQDSPLIKAVMQAVAGFSSGWTKGKQLVLFTVPDSEYNEKQSPLENWPDLQKEIRLNSNGTSEQETRDYYTRNTNTNPLSYVSFTTPICFEDAFNDVCSKLYRLGSEAFIVITNDSWSLTNSAEYQHFIVSYFRAIEYRTTLVRCGKSGYSVVVNPQGKIIDDIPPFTEAAMISQVPVYERKQTVYSKFGDWFAFLCMIFIAIYTLFVLVKIYSKNTDAEKKGKKTRFITITIGHAQENSTNTVHKDDDYSHTVDEPSLTVNRNTGKEEESLNSDKASTGKTAKASVKTVKAESKSAYEKKSASVKKASTRKTAKATDKTETVKKSAEKNIKN